MKKIGKILTLSSLTVATIGTIALTNIGPEILQKPEAKTDIQAYNHNPNTVLENAFESDGKMILPFIFKDADQTITKTYLIEQFQKAGKTIQNASSLKDIIVTGNEIKTEDATYTVRIYGDVNADGYVDVFDAQKALKHYTYEGEKEHTLTGSSAIVANVYNSDDEIDVFDAQRILRFYVGIEPNLVLNDIENPQITLKGENPQYVRLGGKYEEAGATVSDNKDKNLTPEIDSTKVDVNKIGTYEVYYKAIDSDGNKETKKRTVIVRDYVTDLTLTDAPKTVNYGKELDLSSMKVTAKMKSSGDAVVPVDASKYKVTGYNPEKLGPQTITVTYESEDGTFEGKSTTFTVEVKDYQTGIEVEFPKTEYKYQEELTDELLEQSGARARTKMASGAFGEWEPITIDMVYGYDKEQTIKQTLIITYSDEQAEVEIEVKDYATDMNIVAWPTKQDNQKYGKEIDLSGMVINATMAKAGTKTLTPDDYEVKGYNKEQLGQQTITIAYAGFEKPLTVTVVNYITGIRTKIATGAKTIYVEEESFDFTGIQIEKVMAVKEEGVDTIIPMTDPGIVISPYDRKARFGMNEITILYETNETEDGKTVEFSASHKITVLKHLANIRVKPQKLEGYAHEKFSFGTIFSGEQEEQLKSEKVKLFIADKDGNEITNQVGIEKLPLNENGEMPINLTFEEKGDYRLIFYVGDNFADSKIKSEEQTLHITYNPIVTSASILEPTEVEINVRKAKSKERTITFKNIHDDILTDEVLASSVEFTQDAYLTFTKMTNGHPVTSNKENIDMVRITGKEQGATFIRMTVNKGTENEKSIRLAGAVIGPEAKKIIGLTGVGGTTLGDTIRLYQEEQLVDMSNLVTDKNTGIVYTLMEISIVDEDGDNVPLLGSDLCIGNATTNKKLGVRYTGYNANTAPLIDAHLFTDAKEPVSSDEPVKYLGIALADGVGPEELLDRELIIDYYNALNNSQKLTIQIEPLRIRELVITTQNVDDVSNLPTGYNYEEFMVGSIKSGPRQKDVTLTDFYTGTTPNYTVRDLAGNDITNQTLPDGKKTVEVSFGYNNVDREVELKVTARKSGKYMVTCWVMVAGNRVSLTQTVETKTHPEVASAVITDTSAIAVGRKTKRNIQFLNKYGEPIDVNYTDIAKQENGVEARLLNAAGAPTGTITQIELLANSLDGASITLTVKGKVLPTITIDTKENISIEVMNVNGYVSGVEQKNGEYVIRLYETNPSKAGVVDGDDGNVYTLIPIRINNDGASKKVYAPQLALVHPGDEEHVEEDMTGLPYIHDVVVTYSGTESYIIQANMVHADGTVEYDSLTQPVDYLGIALFGEPESKMIGKTITISYPGADPIHIKVISNTTP